MVAETRAENAADTSVPATHPNEQIVLARATWSNTFRVMAFAAVGGWVVAAVLGFTVYKLAERPVPTKYFEAIHGKLIQAVPTDQPLLSSGEILTGAQETLESGFNLIFMTIGCASSTRINGLRQPDSRRTAMPFLLMAI
jgi:hypothetical protein